MASFKPIGSITRGTTNPNRLRRVDRWITRWPGLTATSDPLIVDLGFGANAVTTLELSERIARYGARHSPNVVWEPRVLGIDIDPVRVETARNQLRAMQRNADADYFTKNMSFRQGGFEIPTANDETATVIRAFNVLRQYEQTEVSGAWQTMQSRLTDDGVLIDGTCDELGRISTWIAITHEGPQTLTVSLRLRNLDTPSIAAERLPKSLIHRNVPGEAIHSFFQELDQQWNVHAGLATFSAAQRWVASVKALKGSGWPIRGNAQLWRLGEITLDYAAVAPLESKP